MRAAWLTLVVFSGSLFLFRAVDVHGSLALALGTRLIIMVCFATGLGWSFYAQRASWPGGGPPAPEQVRCKSLAIRLGLVSLLLYPALMAKILPAWPSAVFNFEYLLLLPLLLLLVPAYVRWVEVRMPNPNDDYALLGQALLRQRPWCWREHRGLLLAWAVKLFFIPLMYSWLVQAIEALLDFPWLLNPTVLIAGLFAFGLSIDLLLASGGYFFASRILGNAVRSTDATWLGWLVCVICYPPFLEFFQRIKQQRDDLIWSDWLLPEQPLYWLWALLITASWMIYWLSTVSFGLRFSNLSWRGLVDCGPYRYLKHPAYLSKNIYWWLHTVPFIGFADSIDLLRNLFGLSFVSLIYYLRAKTEERHLMAFPEYAAYAARIERDGLFARCARLWQTKSP